MKPPIYSVTPFTLLDFPQRTACIVWFSGCNMRCGYCHNPQIVKGEGTLAVSGVLSFLDKRRGLLEGVVFSGGEASLSPSLPDLARAAKSMGYAIKLDTNGLRPDLVRRLLEDGLLDYVALDFKAPPEKFRYITRTKKFDEFNETLNFLCQQNRIPFEVRTTVHTDLLEEADISSIIRYLDSTGYSGTYFIQNFQSYNGSRTLGSLPPQKREIERDGLPVPHNFLIEYRNFSA